MVTVRKIEQFLYEWAPKELAAAWDNVGHLVGEGEQQVSKVLIALDITEAVVQEAIDIGADLIIAHHPVINCKWHEVQRICSDDAQGRMLINMIRSNISAICMHTNLDAAEGGVNDILAQKLGLDALELLNEEKIGRIGTLKSQLPLVEFARFVVESLRCNGVRYIDGGRPVHRVAVGGGACSGYIAQAIAQGCDTFVTSDLKYNDFLDTKGLNLIDAGHFPTENVICPVIAQKLEEAFPELNIVLSTAHQCEVIQYCI